MHLSTVLLLAMPLWAQAPSPAAQLAQEPSSQQKIRSALTLCVQVGAEEDGRLTCHPALRRARALAKKKLSAEERAVDQVQGLIASLDELRGRKLPEQLEAEFDAIAKSLPAR